MIAIKQLYRANVNVTKILADHDQSAIELAEDHTLLFEDSLVEKLEKFKRLGGIVQVEPYQNLYSLCIILEHTNKDILEQAVKCTENVIKDNDMSMIL